MFSNVNDVISEEIVPKRKYQKAKIILLTSFKPVPEMTIFSVVPHTAQQKISPIDTNILYIDESFCFSPLLPLLSRCSLPEIFLGLR